ncbi:MAG: hypothetical protein KDA27_10530 [Candidatus Eisenbacteria bacterium]|uniref:Uncharacterized protein n=1 Tax=Eiseniibacteriota bacterium TaxID=2212470 RepID=A0A956SDA2_UNCEI|nr:hypothetical protein [Candidatus Eisenbacteria bacterium]
MQHRSILASALPAMFLVSIALCVPRSGLAGPNANGTLIVHAPPGIVYCDFGTPCEQTDAHGPASCEEANTNVGSPESTVWSVYAAFPQSDAPRLSGVTFGIDYDIDTVAILDSGACGDFELPTGDWPRPGAGTAVTWSVAQTSALTHVYAFAGYEYYGQDVSFDLTPHPSQGGYFADDDVPSNLDPIVDYGKLGFNGNPGYLPCPSGPQLGACCLPDCGPCVVLLREECGAANGNFLGPGTVCDPNPCDCPPYGACCLSDGSCDLGSEMECLDQEGVYQGDDFPCDPNPCEPVPVQRSTWGGVKAVYR